LQIATDLLAVSFGKEGFSKQPFPHIPLLGGRVPPELFKVILYFIRDMETHSSLGYLFILNLKIINKTNFMPYSVKRKYTGKL